MMASPLNGLFQHKRKLREDLRLILQALNSGWDPEPDAKDAIIREVGRLIRRKDLPARVLARLCWVIVKASQVEINTTSIIVGVGVINSKTLTPCQREMRALFKRRPDLRRQFMLDLATGS